MVTITSGQGLDEFVGVVKVLEIQESNFGKQYHLGIEPVDKAIISKGVTGMFHEYIRITNKTTDTSVPEKSIIAQYVRAIEMCCKEAKTKESVKEVLELLKDKKILYRKQVLGSSFKGQKASEHWVPIALQP